MRTTRRDLCAALAAVLLFTAALLVGRHLESTDGSLHLRWPPLYAYWLPHVGPGTPAALTVAVLTVAYGPPLARRLRWRGLLLAGWAGSTAWLWSLALIDGWHRGVAERLTTKYEYLQSVGDVHDVGATLRTFTDHIPYGPDHWPAHVAGHPPGALLTFVGLDRIGLDGGAWAAVWCLTIASTAAVAVLVTVRALCGEETARRAAPFLVLAPAAVWQGVSADGYFTGVTAWAVALLALAATRRVRFPRVAALGSGLLLGLACYLSYGLLLMAPVCLGVLAAARTVRPVPYVLLGIVPWVVAFTAAGFWWYDGYSTLVGRYYDGAAGVRPYGYFLWANPAANVAVVGVATVAALRHAGVALPGAVRGLRRAPAHGAGALALLVAGAACAVLAADLSGMSKAETERIWLPFTLWLLPAAALLPERSWRYWLSAQAVVALTVNHLVVTGW
ncbi:hypothetical protein DVA86_03960 [Streptomyces armeniacus]|uniref:Integral membrane protein n=1 Tax=Streptomyces armeniacus TaxID=83291 RepID=A0A345XJV9_9ACTN|nr:hypothetical protein [Streptomyces armeniacus]AXK31925.1 hypothetical protein DVA86_03960 [Streptomyces armeniacus]